MKRQPAEKKIEPANGFHRAASSLRKRLMLKIMIGIVKQSEQLQWQSIRPALVTISVNMRLAITSVPNLPSVITKTTSKILRMI